MDEEAFSNLPNFAYKPRYGHFQTLRYAFIDEESSFVFHNGQRIALNDVKPGTDIQWETYLCLQCVSMVPFLSVPIIHLL
jgi:hypothetical protein